MSDTDPLLETIVFDFHEVVHSSRDVIITQNSGHELLLHLGEEVCSLWVQIRWTGRVCDKFKASFLYDWDCADLLFLIPQNQTIIVFRLSAKSLKVELRVHKRCVTHLLLPQAANLSINPHILQLLLCYHLIVPLFSAKNTLLHNDCFVQLNLWIFALLSLRKFKSTTSYIQTCVCLSHVYHRACSKAKDFFFYV